MEREELLALLRGNEWDEFEAKEATNGVSKSAYTTVSAFANTKGGWLLFGVAEEKKGLVVKGVSDPDRIQNDFLAACRSTEKFSRPVTVHPHQHELEGKVVLTEDQLRTALTSGGLPCTLEELKDRFADYLNERTKGKDKAKVRLVLE